MPAPVLSFKRYKQRSNGVVVVYIRIYLEIDGTKDWVGEIEPAKDVFRARYHQAFSPALMRAILEKWEAEAPPREPLKIAEPAP